MTLGAALAGVNKVLHFVGVPPKEILQAAKKLLHRDWLSTMDRQVGTSGIENCTQYELMVYIMAIKEETDKVRGMKSVSKKLIDCAKIFMNNKQSTLTQEKMALAFDISNDALENIRTSCSNLRAQMTEKAKQYTAESHERTTHSDIVFYMLAVVIVFDPTESTYSLFYTYSYAKEFSPWLWATDGKVKRSRMEALKAETRSTLGYNLAGVSNGLIQAKEMSAAEYQNISLTELL
ncbi:hypothetical protein BGZ83_011822 [Gryganskiella cystojenkinii]|nr:hypothetical protein BGZ83_011822 [Gryganskiella cystojenkinii]